MGIFSEKHIKRGGVEGPLLSIVVPVYNVEKYFRQCLDSLINQTLKEIEIIVVNDCSPDNSEAIILEYAAKDPRIVYIKHEVNKCLGGARNTGIRAARGKYITFVDSDDYVDKGLYEKAVEALEQYNANVVFFSHIIFGEGKKQQIIKPLFSGVMTMDADTYALSLEYSRPWDKVYRLVDLKENSIYFPENIYYEDNPFWVQYCLAVEPTAIALSANCGGYHYRQHGESITKKRKENGYALPKIFLLIYQHLQRYNKLEIFSEKFNSLVTDITRWHHQIMLPEQWKQYLAEYVKLLRYIISSEKTGIPKEWKILLEIRDFELQKFFIEMWCHNLNVRANRWYQLSQLSFMGKIKFVLKHLVNSLLRKFRFAIGR